MRTSSQNVKLQVSKSRKGSFVKSKGHKPRTSSAYEDRASQIGSMIMQAMEKDYEDVEEESMNSEDIGFGLGGVNKMIDRRVF